MESNKIWKLTLIDPGDGSGDALIELPEELLDEFKWVEGELLEIEQVDQCIVIKKPDAESKSLTIKKCS